MNYLEKNLVNDTVLTGGLLAVAISWVVLAAASADASGGAFGAARDAAAASIVAPGNASLSLRPPTLSDGAADRVS